MSKLPNLTPRQQLTLAIGIVGLALVAALAWVFHFSRIEHYEVRWDHHRQPPTVSGDGHEVTLQYTGGTCDDYAEAEIAERKTSVTITVTVTTKAVSGCDDKGVPRTITVRLEDPIGDRRLIDGADKE